MASFADIRKQHAEAAPGVAPAASVLEVAPASSRSFADIRQERLAAPVQHQPIASLTPGEDIKRRAVAAEAAAIAAPPPSLEERIREVVDKRRDPSTVGMRWGFNKQGHPVRLQDYDKSAPTGERWKNVAYFDRLDGRFRMDLPGGSPGEAMGNAFTQLVMDRLDSAGHDRTSGAVEFLAANPRDIVQFELEAAGALFAPGFVRGSGPAKAAGRASKLYKAHQRKRMLAGGAGTVAGVGASQTFNPSEHPFREARNAAAFDMFGEGLANAIVAKASRVRHGAFFKPELDVTDLDPDFVGRGAKEAIAFNERHGLPLSTTGRLTSSAAADVAETVSGAAFTSFNQIQQKLTSQYVELDKWINEWITGIAGTPDRRSLNILMREIAEGRSPSMWKRQTEHLYGKLDEMGGPPVDMDPVIRRASEVMSELETEGLKDTAAYETMRGLVNRIEELGSVHASAFGQVADVTISQKGIERAHRVNRRAFTPYLNWRQAAKIKSELGMLTGRGESVKGSVESAASRVFPSLKQEMHNAAISNLGDPDFFRVWQAAELFSEGGHQLYGSSVMRALAKTMPDEFYTQAIRARSPIQIENMYNVVHGLPLNPSTGERMTVNQWRKQLTHTIRNAKDARDVAVARESLTALEEGADAWTRIEGQTMRDMLVKSHDVEGSRISARRIRAALTNFDRQAFEAVVRDPKRRSIFYDWVNSLSFNQRPAGRNIPGGVTTQLTQVGMIYGALSGGVSGPLAAFVLSAPRAIAKTLTDERFVKWSIIGSSAKPYSAKAAAAYAKMAAIAASHGAEIYTEAPPESLLAPPKREKQQPKPKPQPAENAAVVSVTP